MRDTLSKRGAESICDTIRAYWLLRGYDVKPYPKQIAMNSHTYIVRSDMVNGHPVRKV